MRINIHEQTEIPLAQLVKQAVAGEEIIFDSNGTAIAKLIPIEFNNKKTPPWWTVEGQSEDC